jgi:hypothetical protein
MSPRRIGAFTLTVDKDAMEADVFCLLMVNSFIVPHSPHDGHFPIHFAASAPHDEQT